MANLYDQFDAQSEVKDLATSFGVGSNQLLKMAGDVYGLATGNMDNVVSRQGQENIDYLQRGKSQKLIDSETRRKAAVDMEEGTLNQALAYVRETFTDPRLFLSTTAEAAPSLVGAGGIGAGARVATGKVLAKVGAEKAAETATKVGVGTAVAAGAGMQGTSVGADQYKEIVELLSNMPEDQALKVPQIVQLVVEKNATLEEAKTALALDLARSTGALSALASIGTQMLPGGRTIEKALVGGAGKKLAGTALARAGAGAIGEGLQEGVEEGSGAGVKNLLARAVDPEREITKGMGEAMGAGFAGAGPIGAAAGAASRPSRPVLASETTAGMSSEPLASDAIPQETRTSTTDTPDLSLEGAGEMNTREVGSVLSARESAARGFTPDPSDIATAESVRRPQIEVSEEAAKAANAPVQEALDEWRTQNPDVGVNITVINDPNMRNTRNYGIRGYFDPNTGEVVINSAFTKPFEVESVVNHEWSHHTLSSEEGRAALVEFATRDIPKEELAALAKRYPNADNLTLVEEWIARSQETSPGTFARIIAKIREWLNGKLGINMSNEEVARVMLRTLRERGAPVAEGSGEMRQTTTEQPLANDATSRASGIMASPSITDIDYPRARQNLTSSAQARFRSQVKDYAPDAVIYNAVGDWKDGAENSVAAIFDTAMPTADLEQLAAKAGLAGDQKAVLWWTTDPNGADAIHRVTWPKEVTMDQARQAMIDAGLENRTLIETPDGVQGFVFDQGQQNLNKISNLHENSTEPSINTQPATGDFLGSGDTRVEGKRAYRAVLGRAEKTETGDRGGQYDQRTGGQPEARYSVTDEPVPETGGAGSGRGGVLSSPSRMDSGTSSKTSSRQPNETVRKIADEYNAQSGQNPIEHGHYVSVDESLAKRIAKAYDALPEVDRSPETIRAYEALAKEVGDQWDFAVNNLGVTFEPWTKEGQPYANSREMVKDVRDNNHIYFFQGGDPHPFLGEVDPETGFTANDKLRAVHDLFGHAAEDYQFGPRGEENAWIKHSQMFSAEAQRALSSETRGQNSWVNFGDQNYENGVNKNIPAKDRPFAAQKTALLPEELTDWRSALGQSEPERSSVLAKQPIRESVTDEPVGQTKKQTESPEFEKWFEVSKVVNEDGTPKVMFHSTTAGDVLTAFKRNPKDVGFHFGTAGQAEDRFNLKLERDPYGPNLRGVSHATIPVFLRINRPLRMDDLGSWSGDNIYFALKNDPEFKGKLFQDSTSAEARDAIKAAGYDGIVYANTGESEGASVYRKAQNEAWADYQSSDWYRAQQAKRKPSDRFPSGEMNALPEYQAYKKASEAERAFRESNPQDSYIAFDSNQVKSATGNTGAFDPKKKDIRYSVTEEPVGQTKKQTESPEFKNWFGDWQDPKAFTSRAKGPVSQVFKDGKPLVVYHATTKDFDAFESGRPTFDDMGFFGNVETNRHAIFFSDVPEQAASYVTDSEGRADTGARTIPAYLDMKSPLYLDRNTRLDDLAEETGVNYNWLQNRRTWWELLDGEDGKMFVEGLKKAGYDGIVFEEDPIRPGVEVGDTYAVFEPSQIKSATGNRGTFDPTNPDIRFSVTDEPVEVTDLPRNLKGDSEGFIPIYITKQNALPTVVVGKNKTVEVPVIDFGQYADRVFKAKGVSELNGKEITLAEAHLPVIQKYYAGLSPETYREKDVRAAADMVANDMSNNLLFLHDLALDTFGPEVVKRMSKWYDGANVIAKMFADKYGVSVEQSAAILATLSPQKHWFANVSLAENVMDVMRNHQDTVFDAAVEKAARASIKNSVGTTSSKRELYTAIRAISGKKLSDLSDLKEQTIFTRFLSQSIHPKRAYIVTPEGQLTPGSSVAVAWSGAPITSNAVSAFLDGSVDNLTVALGGGHKVRNFNGNIIDPMSPFFYTSDTHNVAASLLIPVGGTDFEVSHNFGGNPGVGEGPKLPVIGTTVTGLQGTYPLYLEAGRRAAQQRNVLPRQMQSITWEMIRIMFTDDMKTPAFMDSVKRVHDQVRGGGLDIDSARQNIIELSGGRDAIKARPPEWLNK